MSKFLRSFTVVSIFLFWIGVSTTVFAQPVDELAALKSQLQKLNSRLNELQNGQNEDPFAERVRSVGRQRSAPQPAKQDDSLVIRFYDLSDIFSVAPQYRARMTDDFSISAGFVFQGTESVSTSRGGGLGGSGGGGVFNVPPGNLSQQQAQTMSLSAALVSVDDLIEGIKHSVAPNEWDDTAGDATISVLGNTLLISATDSMHLQIVDLLNLIREHWGKLKTVSVQAYWIRAKSTDIRELLGGEEENRAVGKVERKKWKPFFENAQRDNLVSYSAMLCGHNGQTLQAISGRRKTVVVNATPLYSWKTTQEELDNIEEPDEMVTKSIVGMRPTRRQFHEGAIIQASPLATRGGNYVILDLHTRVNETIEAEEVVDSKIVVRDIEGNDLSLSLHSNPYIAYRMSTTIRCPKDEVMLAGGMTYDSTATGDQPNLYLFVQTRIHTVEEDQSDRKLE